jgi:hypothetical protein
MQYLYFSIPLQIHNFQWQLASYNNNNDDNGGCCEDGDFYGRDFSTDEVLNFSTDGD